MLIRNSLIAIGLVVCMTSSASAISEITIPITEFAVIAPNDRPADISVLMSIPLPDSLSTRTILHAEIICMVRPHLETDSLIQIGVVPIRVPWDPGQVEWDDSWQRNGGNLVDSLTTIHGVQVGETGIPNLDITDFVRRWLEGWYPNYGVAIAPFDWNANMRFSRMNPDRGEAATLRILFSE
jgi:hypothetical protein